MNENKFSTTKLISTLVLIIIFLVSCMFLMGVFFVASWLHTYKAFTDKDLVAVIEIEPQGQDERGFDKFKVTYRQYQGTTGLKQMFFPSSDPSKKEEYVEEFEMFGDRVMVEAHTVKLNDAFTLLNYSALYKITGIEGDFIDDREKAKSLPSSERSIYDLNGGVDDTWKWLQRNEGKLKFVIDTVQTSSQGKTIEKKSWGIYITEEGLQIDDLP